MQSTIKWIVYRDVNIYWQRSVSMYIIFVLPLNQDNISSKML